MDLRVDVQTLSHVLMFFGHHCELCYIWKGDCGHTGDWMVFLEKSFKHSYLKLHLHSTLLDCCFLRVCSAAGSTVYRGTNHHSYTHNNISSNCFISSLFHVILYRASIPCDGWHLSPVYGSVSQHSQCTGSMSSSVSALMMRKRVVSFGLSKQRSPHWTDRGSSNLFIQLPAGCWHESEYELRAQAGPDTQLVWQKRSQRGSCYNTAAVKLATSELDCQNDVLRNPKLSNK